MFNMFNKFFTNNADNIVSTLSQATNTVQMMADINTQCSLFFRPVVPQDIVSVIRSLKNKKSEDIYGISTYILKLCAECIAYPLCEIINTCIEKGVFPKKFKKSKVIAVHKKGDLDNPDNYRQIHLLPAVSKVIEKVLYTQIMQYMETNNLLSKQQYLPTSKGQYYI